MDQETYLKMTKFDRQKYDEQQYVNIAMGLPSLGIGFNPLDILNMRGLPYPAEANSIPQGPYESDSMNRKLAAAKQWLKDHEHQTTSRTDS